MFEIISPTRLPAMHKIVSKPEIKRGTRRRIPGCGSTSPRLASLAGISLSSVGDSSGKNKRLSAQRVPAKVP